MILVHSLPGSAAVSAHQRRSDRAGLRLVKALEVKGAHVDVRTHDAAAGMAIRTIVAMRSQERLVTGARARQKSAIALAARERRVIQLLYPPPALRCHRGS